MKICEHNYAVRCAGKGCERCGWNPAVEAQRKASAAGEEALQKASTVKVDVYDETQQKVVGSMLWPVLGEKSDQYF